jgi:mRNA interferase MazF
VCVVTRDAAIEVLTSVTCAPVIRTIRGIRSEVEVGPDDGLPEPSVVNCDSLMTIPKAVFDPAPVGRLPAAKLIELDRSLRYAHGITW